ncbi:phage/plasmid primase, P4 family [Streptomyces sp. IMTB 1903]|uniref:phage/plasmid primase, P4 family n=1 Tax=Streptomyces sp. IMTB 1903 TaxID=1776680 RepID=UPI0007560E98|nr:phage/plasmid primase, P4 family [Streptomyces sp. IMTB 1903]
MTNTTIETRTFPTQQVAEFLRETWAEYHAQGLTVFPVKRGDKHPGDMGIKWGEDWVKKGRPTFPDLADVYGTLTFRGHGLWLATGQVSKRVVLDLDSDAATDHWRGRLGEAVFNSALKVSTGRDGGSKRHLHFRIRPDDDRPWPGHSDDTLGYDFRGDGGGVIMPPSFHKSGRRYEWLDGKLMDAPECLRKENQPRQQKAAQGPCPEGSKVVQALMLDPLLGARGNNWLASIAGTMAKAFFSEDLYRAVLWNINQASADPIEEDAFTKTVGSIWRSEQQEGPRMPSPDSPVKVARQIIERMWTAESRPTLLRWRGSWVQWTGAHWREVEHQSITASIQAALEHARYEGKDRTTGERKMIPWDPNTQKVNDVANAVKNVSLLSQDTESGSWLDAREGGQVVAFQNGLLDFKKRTMSPATAAYFNTSSLPYDYEDTDETPTEWLKFLASVWPEDDEPVKALQEWFGYVLSGQTDLQKALMLIGPPRSGKGTIAAILEALVGYQNMAGPTLSSLSQNFGLQSLIGKSIAVIDDARSPNRDRDVILERLLSVIGQGVLTVDRKNREPWIGRISARVMLMSNELPSFADSSGAFAGRFVILVMTNSFLNKEDPHLRSRLLNEIPAILRWSLDGLDRLTERGRFIEPKASAGTRDDFEDSTAKVKAFVEHLCEVGLEYKTVKNALFQVWVSWCEQRKFAPGTESTFAKNLKAYNPKIESYRSRVKDDKNWYFTGIRLATR